MDLIDHIHYTHRRLGTKIGVKREAVTRAITEVQDRELVELRRRLIYIADAKALRRDLKHIPTI